MNSIRKRAHREREGDVPAVPGSDGAMGGMNPRDSDGIVHLRRHVVLTMCWRYSASGSGYEQWNNVDLPATCLWCVGTRARERDET